VTAAGAGAFGIAALLAAGAPTLALEMAALALLGAAAVTFAASINTGLQLAAEPEMRGRVLALYSIVFLGSTPIGGPIAGWLAEAVSPRAALVMGGFAGIAVALAAAAALRGAPSPVVEAEVPEAPDTPEPAAAPCDGRGSISRSPGVRPERAVLTGRSPRPSRRGDRLERRG
jgi:MFS family permease